MVNKQTQYLKGTDVFDVSPNDVLQFENILVNLCQHGNILTLQSIITNNVAFVNERTRNIIFIFLLCCSEVNSIKRNTINNVNCLNKKACYIQQKRQN